MTETKRKRGYNPIPEEVKAEINDIWIVNCYCPMPLLAQLTGYDKQLCKKVTDEYIRNCKTIKL